MQTAEGALTETHSILQRMRDLAVQASNDGSLNADRASGSIQTEMTPAQRASSTASPTPPRSTAPSCSTAPTPAAFQVGANAGETITVAIGSTAGHGRGRPRRHTVSTCATRRGRLPRRGHTTVAGTAGDRHQHRWRLRAPTPATSRSQLQRLDHASAARASTCARSTYTARRPGRRGQRSPHRLGAGRDLRRRRGRRLRLATNAWSHRHRAGVRSTDLGVSCTTAARLHAATGATAAIDQDRRRRSRRSRPPGRTSVRCRTGSSTPSTTSTSRSRTCPRRRAASATPTWRRRW